MSLSILMGGGMPSPEEKDEPSEAEASGDDDDEAISELGAKYAQRFGEAIEAKDWSEAYKAFGRMKELCELEEAQERGY